MTSRGFSLVEELVPLTVLASLAAQHGLRSCSLYSLGHASPAAVAHSISCLMGCGISSDQGSNLCPLRWQAGS